MRHAGKRSKRGAGIFDGIFFQGIKAFKIGYPRSRLVMAHDTTAFDDFVNAVIFIVIRIGAIPDPFDNVKAFLFRGVGFHRAVQLVFQNRTGAVAIIAVYDVFNGQAEFAVRHAMRKQYLDQCEKITDAHRTEVAGEQDFNRCVVVF